MSSSSSVDAKLLHLVKKILAASSTPTTSSNSNSSREESHVVRPNNVAHILQQLTSQHKEYLRKDSQLLTIQIETALKELLLLQQLEEEEPSTTRQRKRKSREQDEEDEYDRAVAQEEAIREQVIVNDSYNDGGLNASLRQRYKQVQQERQEKKKEETIVESPLPTVKAAKTTTTTTTTTASKGSTKKRKNGNKQRSDTFSPATAAAASSSSSSLFPPGFLSPVTRPTERYSDLGGMDDIVVELKQLVEYPMIRPELYNHLGIDPPRGVLLRGPPGVGKSHLANAVAGELGVPFFRVSAPELVSGMSGESEGRIRDLFQAASDVAPSLIFLDELDAIAPKRSDASSSRGMEKRMVAQLLLSMDMIRPQNNRKQAAVLVLAASNRPDALDPALRRAGRFDKEIRMGVPDEAARERILRAMTKDMRLSGDFDYKVLARKTPGFVGADVRSLAREAAVIAIDRIFHDVLGEQHEDKQHDSSKDAGGDGDNRMNVAPLTTEQMEPLFVTMDDFLQAVPLVQPSSKREGFATVPDVSWEAIGALESIREELTISVLEPIRNPEKFQALGLTLPAGVLLYGPPGCGKTLLAKAIAHESGANFISVKGPELLDKYVGESERAVRQVFDRARASSPCIIFFDELDSLVPKRGSDGGSGGGVSERVVNQLLTELDGLDSRRSVFVIGATNRPELIDSAMLRPGRLDRLLYVPLPTAADRVSILKALASGVALADDVDIVAIGQSPRANGYSGADCAALLRESGLAVLKEDAAAHAAGALATELGTLRITARHFEIAFGAVMPSVSKKDQARYDRMRDRMARARSRGDVIDHGEAADNDGDEKVS